MTALRSPSAFAAFILPTRILFHSTVNVSMRSRIRGKLPRNEMIDASTGAALYLFGSRGLIEANQSRANITAFIGALCSTLSRIASSAGFGV